MPMAPYLYTVSTMHCMSVSLGLDGAGLGTCWGRELATSMLADAGFTDVDVREIESDPLNFYYVCRSNICPMGVLDVIADWPVDTAAAAVVGSDGCWPNTVTSGTASGSRR